MASLAVTFFWPFSGGYHVIALDKARELDYPVENLIRVDHSPPPC